MKSIRLIALALITTLALTTTAFATIPPVPPLPPVENVEIAKAAVTQTTYYVGNFSTTDPTIFAQMTNLEKTQVQVLFNEATFDPSEYDYNAVPVAMASFPSKVHVMLQGVSQGYMKGAEVETTAGDGKALGRKLPTFEDGFTLDLPGLGWWHTVFTFQHKENPAIRVVLNVSLFLSAKLPYIETLEPESRSTSNPVFALRKLNDIPLPQGYELGFAWTTEYLGYQASTSKPEVADKLAKANWEKASQHNFSWMTEQEKQKWLGWPKGIGRNGFAQYAAAIKDRDGNIVKMGELVNFTYYTPPPRPNGPTVENFRAFRSEFYGKGSEFTIQFDLNPNDYEGTRWSITQCWDDYWWHYEFPIRQCDWRSTEWHNAIPSDESRTYSVNRWYRWGVTGQNYFILNVQWKTGNGMYMGFSQEIIVKDPYNFPPPPIPVPPTCPDCKG